MMYAEIRRMLAGILGQDEAGIAPGTKLWRSVDAVSLAKLVIACERRYRITIDDERVPDLKRLQDLVEYVRRKASEGRDDYVQPDERGRDAWYYE
jgi:acyl carrier protein